MANYWILFLIALPFVVVGYVNCMRVGLLALERTRAAIGEWRRVHRYVAIILLEPWFNTFLIVSIIRENIFDRGSLNAALATLPMVVLLIPINALTLYHPLARTIGLEALTIGLTRWGCAIAVALSLFHSELIIFLVPAIMTLFYTPVWGKNALARLVQP